MPGESHGQRSLAGYSPKGHKALDTTEQLSARAQRITVNATEENKIEVQDGNHLRGGEWVWGRGGATFYRMVREGLTEEAASEQRHEEGEDCMDAWTKYSLAKTELIRGQHG